MNPDDVALLKTQLTALLRNLLVAGGASLGAIATAKGITDAATWGVIWTAVSGVAISLLGIGWSILDKKWVAAATAVQKVSAYNAGVVVADATVGPTARAVDTARVDTAVAAVASAASPTATNLPSPAALAAAAVLPEQAHTATPVTSLQPER
jgi:hypothetical protein